MAVVLVLSGTGLVPVAYSTSDPPEVCGGSGFYPGGNPCAQVEGDNYVAHQRADQAQQQRSSVAPDDSSQQAQRQAQAQQQAQIQAQQQAQYAQNQVDTQKAADAQKLREQQTLDQAAQAQQQARQQQAQMQAQMNQHQATAGNHYPGVG